MNRKNFIKYISSIPLLGFILQSDKAEVTEYKEDEHNRGVNVHTSENLKVTIQKPDGSEYEFTMVNCDLSVNQDLIDITSWGDDWKKRIPGTTYINFTGQLK